MALTRDQAIEQALAYQGAKMGERAEAALLAVWAQGFALGQRSVPDRSKQPDADAMNWLRDMADADWLGDGRAADYAGEILRYVEGR